MVREKIFCRIYWSVDTLSGAVDVCSDIEGLQREAKCIMDDMSVRGILFTHIVYYIFHHAFHHHAAGLPSNLSNIIEIFW
jgi:hypothetical protein